jgi:phosphoglucomutase
MSSYRDNMPKRMNDSRVLSVTDFSKQENRVDADGKEIPASNFVLIHLLDGCSIAIRPSGTEPKLKMYLFGKSEVQDGDDLPAIKEEVGHRLETLKSWLLQDVSERSK